MRTWNSSIMGGVIDAVRHGLLCVLGVAALTLGACGGDGGFTSEGAETAYPQDRNRYGGVIGRPATEADRDSIFGEDGLTLFGDGGAGGGGGLSVGVNSYLWRASLDTISFMPLSSADPFGGVIITDWYTPPETPQERFKVNIYILGSQLRADGVRAAVFRQQRDDKGSWIDAAVEAKTSTDLENSILTRARQLRINSAPS